MSMTGKKERSRFSIKFNENDPMHEIVIGILEHQGPRQKAQFIANAVLHYMNCSETPDLKAVQTGIDKAAIERVVLEILEQQGEQLSERKRQAGKTTVPKKMQHIPVEKKDTKKAEFGNEVKEPIESSKNLDEMAKALIADTMLAFRSN